MPSKASHLQQPGLRPNLGQFLLLMAINGFVGAMVGQERTILPLIAARDFDLASRTAAFSFLISFGLTKAAFNLLAGSLADRFGRRRTLVAGWVFGLPVPLVLIFADQWRWIVAANVLLGINQALCWSATVIMKIDLAGRRQAGLATAANEWAGYAGAAGAAWLTGRLAAAYGLRPFPFYTGLAAALAGLLCSVFLVKPTREQIAAGGERGKEARGKNISLAGILRLTWSDTNLLTTSQAGLITNLKDGLLWGLLPIYLHQGGLAYGQIGVVTAVYPAVWAFSQLATGPLSDRWGRKWLISAGLGLQSLGLLLFFFSTTFESWLGAATVTGLGTGLAYPTLLAAASDLAPPGERGSVLGGYRFWRDAGYAAAGIGIGPLTAAWGSKAALLSVLGLTAVSALLVALFLERRLS